MNFRSVKRIVRRTVQAHAYPMYRFLSGIHQSIRRFLIWRKLGLPLRAELAAYQSMRRAQMFKPIPQPVHYVGTETKEGIAQLAILMNEGCRPEHKVLEIGCGALCAGYPIMQYLNTGNYHGIEPNRWLVDDALKIPEIHQTATTKAARFTYNDTFDGTVFQTTFDYVISHSVLSHAAHWQWPLFLKNVDTHIRRGSKIIASLDLNKPNGYGSKGYPGNELDFSTWQYPGNSFFRQETILNLAHQYGYAARIDLACAALITRAHNAAVHDWIILEKL
jgi:methyltransferase family protein